MASSGRIEELKKKFDENPRRYFAPLANEYRKAGDIAQAIAICQEHLPQQPGHMSGHIVYGQALFEAGQYPEARTVFETALTLDPENLIALRQLGDIARIQGEPGDARRWYERVLEADPRNEEILGLLSTLEGGAHTPTPIVNPVIPAEPIEPLSLSDLETVEIRPIQRPSAPAETPVGERPLETVPPETDLPDFSDLVERASEGSPEIAGNAPASVPPLELDSGVPGTTMEHPATGDVGGIAGLEPTHFGGGHEVEHAALEGFETGEFASPGAEAPETSADVTGIVPAAEPESQPEPGIERAESPIEELEVAASAAPEQELELIQPQATEPAEEHTEEPQRPSPDLELIQPEAEAPEPTESGEAEAPALSEESATELPLIPADESEPEEPAPAEPAVFVTETMAELLVSQGHRERALEVYAQLVEASPEDTGLRARHDALRDEIARAATPIAAPAISSMAPTPVIGSVAVPPPAPRKTGPTIRDFLGAIAARRPGDRPSAMMETPVFSMEPVAAVPPAPPADEAHAVPAVRPGGTIDALFAHVDAHRDDVAAQRLADAFGQHATSNGASAPVAASEPVAAAAPEPVRGAPARQASRELSLDEVFNDKNAPAPAAPGFSFDQFFANGAANQGGATESSAAPAATSAPDDDIRQFTAWLEGLKKS